MTLTLFINDWLFVMNRSKVLFPLVGSVTNCDSPQSSSRSTSLVVKLGYEQFGSKQSFFQL